MKIIKLQNGELDWEAMYDQSSLRTMIVDIETEPLERFVIDSMYPSISCLDEPTPLGAMVTTDEQAATHAAELIILVMGAIRKGEKVGPLLRGSLRERKERSNLFYPDKTTSTDPAWQIAKDRMLGIRAWDKTITKWKAEVCYGGDRTIKGWVSELEPRIMDTFTPDEALAYLKTGRAKKRV